MCIYIYIQMCAYIYINICKCIYIYMSTPLAAGLQRESRRELLYTGDEGERVTPICTERFST